MTRHSRMEIFAVPDKSKRDIPFQERRQQSKNSKNRERDSYDRRRNDRKTEES